MMAVVGMLGVLVVEFPVLYRSQDAACLCIFLYLFVSVCICLYLFVSVCFMFECKDKRRDQETHALFQCYPIDV